MQRYEDFLNLQIFLQKIFIKKDKKINPLTYIKGLKALYLIIYNK
jgi:hypothetical protein